MQHFLESFSDTAANLACDDWLLQQCDSSESPCEVLRIWENPELAAILGRSSKTAVEINTAYCQQNGIPAFRRCSGGASVMIGPGCLMYAVVLDYRLRPHLKMLDRAHAYVMEKMQTALAACGIVTQFLGTCDLTVDSRKFSGNSLRCQRNSFLYHGTLLYDFDLALLQQCLGIPPRQPDYRAGRGHQEFVTNLAVDRAKLTAALLEAWNPSSPYPVNDLKAIDSLAASKYRDAAWNNKL